MSRAIAYSVILILLLVFVFVGGHLAREDGETESVAPEFDLGSGYGYQKETLARFQLLVGGEDWTLADPPRNSQGMLEVVHVKTGLTFVLIPAGSFEMGSPKGENGRYSNEGPVHTVTVPAFLLCKTECTQRAWERGGGENRSQFKGADRPVEMVRWTECRDWCARNALRLPSEAEWECACRAGTSTPFSTGHTLTMDQANFWPLYPRDWEMEHRKWTLCVGSMPPNPWGLHEMHGNVAEWCEDSEHDSYKGAPSDGSAWTEGGALLRGLRGGFWGEHGGNCRSATRGWFQQYFPISYLGLRPAADLRGIR